MSLRPRFAGDGRLRLPMTVAVVAESSGAWESGDVVGELGDGDYDPFERVASGLLLAEEFARVELTEPTVAVGWRQHHGVVDLGQRGTPPLVTDLAHGRASDTFRDRPDDVQDHQQAITWHLRALARLSDHLPGRGRTPGKTPADWNPRWVEPAFNIGTGLYWPGAGATDDERYIEWSMAAHPEPAGVIPPGMDPATYLARSRRGHAAYQTMVREQIAVLPMAPPGRREFTDVQYGISQLEREARALLEGVGTGWWDLAELQRRLMEPYVLAAGDRHIETGWTAGCAGGGDDERRGPLTVHERRRWGSLLLPVYAQLFEGLRRVTEGQRGAAFCRECGQPFLTLDARRSSFCTDRERFRFTQRERRKRLATPPPLVRPTP